MARPAEWRQAIARAKREGWDPRRIADWQDVRAVLDGCWFDPVAADHVLEFFRRYLRHSKGRWHGQPFELLPWEVAVLERLFGWKRADGTRRYRRGGIWIPKKNGKALGIDTPIPTPSGWTTMGDLRMGDRVFSADGIPTLVIGTTPVLHGRACFRVTFSDGQTVIADGEHLWRTYSLQDERSALRTTRRIAEAVTSRRDGARNHSVGLAAPLQLADLELPIDPYVLGVWLGDGDSSSARLTCAHADREIVAAVAASGLPVREYVSRRERVGRYLLGTYGRGAARSRSLQAALRSVGLLNNKHIPAIYLRASLTQRLALIQGLMDTDGYVSADGQCEFTTTKPAICESALELLTSLGFKPSVTVGRATLHGKDCGDKYRVQFWCFTDSDRIVFRLARKRARLRAPMPDRRARSASRQIVSVQPVESVPVRCIQVAAPDGMFLCGRGMIPTHNSTLAAGIELYLLVGDHEAGPEVYSAANDRGQAGIIYHEAANMVRASPALKKRLQPVDSRKTIAYPGMAGFLQALSADVPTKEGINAHGVINDELHAQRKRGLWDVLAYAGAARTQPLNLSISTAGVYDPTSIGWEQYTYAKGVLEGAAAKEAGIHDWAFFALVYEATAADDWTAPATWKKANPSFGVTIDPATFAEECREAQAEPRKENTFKRYRLNMWTQQVTRWIPLPIWDANHAHPVTIDRLTGARADGGLDLGSVSDLSAWVTLFECPEDPDALDILARFWVPEAALDLAPTDRPKNRNAELYQQWVKDGYLETTPGTVTDYDFIEAAILADAELFELRSVVLDRLFQGQEVSNHLTDEGVTVIAMGQGFLSMGAPMKEFERRWTSKRIHHGGHPILRWMAGHCEVKQDPHGNLKIVKPNSPMDPRKVDGLVALVMGLDQVIRHDDAPAEDPDLVVA